MAARDNPSALSVRKAQEARTPLQLPSTARAQGALLQPQLGLFRGKIDTGTEPVRSVLRWAAAQHPGGDF